MAIRYFNIKGNHGVETFEEIDSNDFDNIKEFRKEVRRLTQEHTKALKMPVYVSRRCTNYWKERQS